MISYIGSWSLELTSGLRDIFINVEDCGHRWKAGGKTEEGLSWKYLQRHIPSSENLFRRLLTSCGKMHLTSIFFFSRKQQKPTYILWITCTWEISIKETVFPLLLLTDQQLTEASCSNVSFLFWSFPGRKLQLCYGNRNTLFKATLFQVICHKLKIILITSKWTCFVCQILSFPECLNNIRSRLTLKYAQGLLASC